MSRACKNVIFPSGLIGTSVRAVSGILKSERFRTSPGPSVNRCCQPARWSGVRTDRETLGVAGSAAAISPAAAAASAPKATFDPASRHVDKQIHLFKEGLFIVSHGCGTRNESQPLEQDLKWKREDTRVLRASMRPCLISKPPANPSCQCQSFAEAAPSISILKEFPNF